MKANSPTENTTEKGLKIEIECQNATTTEIAMQTIYWWLKKKIKYKKVFYFIFCVCILFFSLSYVCVYLYQVNEWVCVNWHNNQLKIKLRKWQRVVFSVGEFVFILSFELFTFFICVYVYITMHNASLVLTLNNNYYIGENAFL